MIKLTPWWTWQRQVLYATIQNVTSSLYTKLSIPTLKLITYAVLFNIFRQKNQIKQMCYCDDPLHQLFLLLLLLFSIRLQEGRQWDGPHLGPVCSIPLKWLPQLVVWWLSFCCHLDRQHLSSMSLSCSFLFLLHIHTHPYMHYTTESLIFRCSVDLRAFSLK